MAKGNAALITFEEVLEARTGIVPDLVLEAARLYYHHVAELSQSIAALERQMKEVAKQDDIARRLQTMPGIGPSMRPAFLPLRHRWKASGRGATLQHG